MPVSPLDCSKANRSAKPESRRQKLRAHAGSAVPHPLDWHAVMQP